MKTKSTPAHPSAFSLLELLMVMAIMAIVARFLIPAVGQLVRGTPLTQATQVVSAVLGQARQYAVTKNRPVEVRFIQYGDPEVPGESKDNADSGKYRALQLMEVLDSGALVALDRPRVLLNPVMMNAGSTSSLSTLLDSTIETQKPIKASDKHDGQPAESNPLMPRGIERKYNFVAFRFLPNGSTNLDPLKPTDGWYVTLHNSTDVITGGKLPPNFSTIQVDPINGTLKTFRPGLK